MALTGKIFGKTKRRGLAGAVHAESHAGPFSTPKFTPADAEAFWAWFSENADTAATLDRTLQKSDGDPERLVGPLFDALQIYHGGLSLLVGVNETGESELVISANGVFANFPAVARLVGTAPRLTGWSIIAFKPRVAGTTQFSVNGETILPQAVNYRSRSDEARHKLDLEIELPWLGQISPDALQQIAYLLLENLLGEYDAATWIGAVNVAARPKGREPAGKTLLHLPSEVDSYNAKRLKH